MATEYPTSTRLSWDLIERYLADEVTPDERVAVAAALAAQPEANAAIERFQTTLLDLDPRPDPTVLEQSLRQVHRRAETEARTQHAPSRARRVGAIALGAAAVGLVAIVVKIGHRTPSSPQAAAVYRTQPGQRSIVPLGGGSTMMLAPSTSVAVTSHGIEVSGAAYFRIAANASRPVVVQTRNAVVQVLGTNFTVRQYPRDLASQVVVEDGKVAVRTLSHSAPSDTQHNAQAVLSAQMLAQITDSGVAVTRGIAIRDYTGWTRGVLEFDETTLSDVAAELARVYGADIRIGDTLFAKQKVTAEVAIDRLALTQVLDFIGRITDAHYTHVDHSYVLLPGRVAAQSPDRSRRERQRFPQPEQQYGK